MIKLIKEAAQAIVDFYAHGYEDLIKVQMKEQAGYYEILRQKKLEERYLYYRFRGDVKLTESEQREWDYLKWYQEDHLKKIKP